MSRRSALALFASLRQLTHHRSFRHKCIMIASIVLLLTLINIFIYPYIISSSSFHSYTHLLTHDTLRNLNDHHTTHKKSEQMMMTMNASSTHDCQHDQHMNTMMYALDDVKQAPDASARLTRLSSLSLSCIDWLCVCSDNTCINERMIICHLYACIDVVTSNEIRIVM